ncbi:hypothetical protein QQP08_026114 [Theobroma cacao]|nr:hypothetical protein QQP08_026114 [Theobroma cacao]
MASHENNWREGYHRKEHQDWPHEVPPSCAPEVQDWLQRRYSSNSQEECHGDLKTTTRVRRKADNMLHEQLASLYEEVSTQDQQAFACCPEKMVEENLPGSDQAN